MTVQPIGDSAALTPATDRRNPYIGPRPYADEERERRLFFGRDRESADLLSLVLAERLVLFYAPSSAGKSSLINARLLPALRSEAFAILGKVRVGGQLPQDLPRDAIANVYLFNLLRDLDQGRRDLPALATQRLPAFLAALPADPDRPDRILIIDQFEELFTTYTDQWEKREDFFRQLGQALADDPHLWVMLTMREDYIAELDPYTRLLPNRLRVRYRLQYMDAAAALEAVKQPAALAGRPFEPGVAETLVNNLRQMTPGDAPGAPPRLGETIEPVQLQVVCMQLWESLAERPGETITAADVASLGRGAGLGEFVNHALASFYEQTLAAVTESAAGRISQRELRDWFSHTLITRDGTRNLLYQSDAETGGLPNDVVLELERRFLLRGETRSGGRWVELVHDRLVAPITDANEQWRRRHPLVIAADVWNSERRPALLLTGQALADARQELARNPAHYGPIERQLVASSAEAEAERLAAAAIAEQRRQQEAARSRVVTIAATVTALIMLLLLLTSLWFGLQAFRNYITAQDATDKARRAEAAAKEQAQNARERAAEAEAARIEADRALRRAEQLNRQIRADQLASQAVLALEQSPQQALLLAVEAMRLGATGDAAQLSHAVEQGIHDVLHATGGAPLATLSDDAVALLLAPDGRWFAAATADGALHAWTMHGAALDAIDLLPPASHTTWALAAAPDGRLAAVGDDGLVRVWRIDAPAAPQIFAADGAPLNAAGFSPDGRWLAAAGESGDVHLFDTATPGAAPQILRGHTAPVNILAFSPDNRWLATGGSDGEARLWSLEAPATQTASVPHGAPISALAFNPGATTLTSGDAFGRVRIYTLPGPETMRLAGAVQELPGHTAPIRGLAYSSNGVWLATGDESGVLRVWNLKDATRNYTVRAHQAVLTGLAFVLGADGDRLITTGYDSPGAASVRLWTYSDVGVAPEIVRGHDGEINLLATAPGVNGFLTAGYDRGVRIWLVDDPHAEPTTLVANTPFVDELTTAPISATLYAVGANLPAVQVWNMQKSTLLTPLTTTLGNGLTTLAATPDGALVAAGDAAGTIHLWATGEITPFATLEGHAGKVNSVALAPGGDWLASAGDDGAVRLWNLRGDVVSRTLSADTVSADTVNTGIVRPTAVQFSADGAQVAAADSAGIVSIWQVAQPDAAPLALAAGDRELSTVAFSPDGAWLAAGDLGGRIWVWELAQPEHEPRVWKAHANEVNTVIFGADRGQLISVSADRTVRLWNLDAALPIPTVLTGHGASVNSVNAAGELYTVSTDGTLRTWLLAPEALAARACTVAGRNLYADEWARYLPDTPCQPTCPGLPDRCAKASPTAP